MSEKNKWAERIFTVLMCHSVQPGFRFPGGLLAAQTVGKCLEELDNGTGALSREKVVDFCVCQVCTINSFGTDYLNRWRVTHSFGQKALLRFHSSSPARRHYEDKWLLKIGLSRACLLDMIRDRSQHPLTKFIYPEYEDQTKARLVDTETGLYLCTVSTLMWTPFSPVCEKCTNQEVCCEMTAKRYPELYRLRVEHFRKGGGL